jgi:hypothetical protein
MYQLPRSGNILLFDYAILCKNVKIFRHDNKPVDPVKNQSYELIKSTRVGPNLIKQHHFNFLTN